MTSPAMDQTHPAFNEACDACRTLAGPCRSHLRTYESTAESLVAQEPHSTPPGWEPQTPEEEAAGVVRVKTPDCGKAGCTNPTTHSHKASERSTVTLGGVQISPPSTEPGLDFGPPVPTAEKCPDENCTAIGRHRHGDSPTYLGKAPFDAYASLAEQNEEHLMERPLAPGMWVKIWGVVTDRRTHPDDVVVRIWEHNADSLVTVRRDYVQQAEIPPVFATLCTALRHDQHLRSYVRCDSYAGDGHAHRDGRIGAWPEGTKVHHVEEG